MSKFDQPDSLFYDYQSEIVVKATILDKEDFKDKYYSYAYLDFNNYEKAYKYIQENFEDKERLKKLLNEANQAHKILLLEVLPYAVFCVKSGSKSNHQIILLTVDDFLNELKRDNLNFNNDNILKQDVHIDFVRREDKSVSQYNLNKTFIPNISTVYNESTTPLIYLNRKKKANCCSTLSKWLFLIVLNIFDFFFYLLLYIESFQSVCYVTAVAVFLLIFVSKINLNSIKNYLMYLLVKYIINAIIFWHSYHRLMEINKFLLPLQDNYSENYRTNVLKLINIYFELTPKRALLLIIPISYFLQLSFCFYFI